MNLESAELFRDLWQADLNYSQLCFPAGRQLVSFCGLFGVLIFSLPVPAAQLSMAPGCWVLLGCPEKDPWGLWVLPWHWEKETGACQSTCWQAVLACEARPAGMQIPGRQVPYSNTSHMWCTELPGLTSMCVERKPLEVSWSPLFREKKNTSGKSLFLKPASIDCSV